MAQKLAEAALMSHSTERHCDHFLTAQSQLNTSLSFYADLGVETTPQTEAFWSFSNFWEN